MNTVFPNTLTIAAACGSSYRVRAGDTLAKIASRCGVKKSALQAANGISSNRQLRVGMVLSIPRTRTINGPRPLQGDTFYPPTETPEKTQRPAPTPEPIYPSTD